MKFAALLLFVIACNDQSDDGVFHPPPDYQFAALCPIPDGGDGKPSCDDLAISKPPAIDANTPNFDSFDFQVIDAADFAGFDGDIK